MVSGISGAVVLAVFSSNLAETGFSIPRTVPATAVLFSEPNLDIPRTTISRRQSSSSHSLEPHSCPRPIIRLGQKIDNAHKNSVKSDENCEYLEFSASNVKLTEIGEASGQLPGEVCHI